MNSLLELKKAFDGNQKSKKEYISEMYKYHRYFFDYTELLQTTEIKDICISKDSVIFTLENGIKLSAIQDDERIIPIEILNFGKYEEDLWDKVIKNINNPKVIFDIGANIGYFSLYFAQRFSNASIYSFEPIPNNYKFASKNIENNSLSDNIKLFNIGLTDESKNIEMVWNKKCCGNSSMKNLSDEEFSEKIVCKFSTLDEFVVQNNVSQLDLIKIDTEGSEKFVLEGGQKSLSKFKPVVFCEMLRKWCSKFDYHPNDIIKLMSNLNYKCYAIDVDTFAQISEVTEDTVQTNFVFMQA